MRIKMMYDHRKDTVISYSLQGRPLQAGPLGGAALGETALGGRTEHPMTSIIFLGFAKDYLEHSKSTNYEKRSS